MEKIVLFSDDPQLFRQLKEALDPVEYRIDVLPAAENVVRVAAQKAHSLFVLDAGLPHGGCFARLAALRKATAHSIVISFQYDDPASYIAALEIGADDCFAKPVHPREAAARIRSLLRRAALPERPISPADAAALAVDDVVVDPRSREARCRGTVMDLTAAEFAILEMLLRHAGRVVAREQLMRGVFGRELSAFDRSLDMHISNIRKKLRIHSPVERIKTVRGFGYQYVFSPGGPEVG